MKRNKMHASYNVHELKLNGSKKNSIRFYNFNSIFPFFMLDLGKQFSFLLYIHSFIYLFIA